MQGRTSHVLADIGITVSRYRLYRDYRKHDSADQGSYSLELEEVSAYVAMSYGMARPGRHRSGISFVALS